MRKIELKSVPVRTADRELPDFVFADGLKQLTEFKEGGVQSAELRQIIRLHDAIDAAVDARQPCVLIEDRDWEYLCDRMKAHKWTFAHRAFVQLEDAVFDAPSVDVTQVTPLSVAAE